jgi:ABC-2 type transport system permease protein
MTLLSPFLFALVWVVPAWLAMNSSETKKIMVIDNSGIFKNKLRESDKLEFTYTNSALETAKNDLERLDYYALLYIPAVLDIQNPQGITLIADNSPSLEIEQSIEERLEEIVKEEKIKQAGIDQSVLKSLETRISLSSKVMSKDGDEKDSSSLASFIVGFAAAFLIYMFIFVYGAQIMRGVIEEKTNRIIEVMISTVKPFDLMMGKILGIAMVGLTQFLLWTVLTLVLSSTLSAFVLKDNIAAAPTQQIQTISKNQATEPIQEMQKGNAMTQVLKAVATINFPLILGCFLFYFMGGYFFYGALFAAIGSAVDNETDTQQFMMPITIPLIVAIIAAQFIIQDPNSTLAWWLSMIPFTSPITMMIRLPFGVPTYELILSMGLLIAGFIATTWLAARIYRVGILMYGKKVTYKELSKWLFYK